VSDRPVQHLTMPPEVVDMIVSQAVSSDRLGGASRMPRAGGGRR
jgi:hypothetical protein